MRDGRGEGPGSSSESEKGWASEDEPDTQNPDPARHAPRGRHLPPMQQVQPPRASAGEDTAAVLPGLQSNPTPVPCVGAMEHGTGQPESEPSMTSSEPTSTTGTDPLEEEEDPWSSGQDPWANGRDPWTRGGNQQHPASQHSNGTNTLDGNNNANTAVGADGRQANGRPNVGANGRGQQNVDPWGEGNDPWSQGSQRKNWGTSGKGAPGEGWQGGGKGQKGAEDPVFANDPWAAAAGKGKHPTQLNKGKGTETFSQAPKPKPPPPKPPSSDGEDSTWSRARSSAPSGVGTAGQSRVQRGIGPDELPEKAVDYLDYQNRCLQLGAAQSRCCAVEVQPSKRVTLPGFLRCELGQTLLLRFVRDDFALLEDFPSKTGQRMGWVPLDSVKPVEPYDFQVKVIREPGSPLGLLGEELDFPDNVTRIMVVKVDEGSALSAWNDRCRQCHPRDQILPGDLIIAVNRKTDLDGMFNELMKDGLLLLLVLRHEQRLHPSWTSLQNHDLQFLGKEAPPSRAPPDGPHYTEIDHFQ
eukprot:s673_g19.t1